MVQEASPSGGRCTTPGVESERRLKELIETFVVVPVQFGFGAISSTSPLRTCSTTAQLGRLSYVKGSKNTAYSPPYIL